MTGAAATELMLPALRGAYQRAAHSSSSGVRARPVIGSHLFQIDGYKLVHRMVDGPIMSRKFRVGGLEWRVAYSPNAYAHGRFVGAGFHLAAPNHTGKDLSAMCQLSVLDCAGVPAFSRLIELRDQIYSYRLWWSAEADNFVSKEELLKWVQNHIDDDRLHLRCDVIVLRMHRTPNLMS